MTEKVGEAGAAVKPNVVDSAVSLYTKGIDRLAEVQKKYIDVAAQQNAELIGAWKKLAETVPVMSGTFMLDQASSAIERLAETQKSAIDLVVEQSHALAGLVKERADAATKVNKDAVQLVKQMVDRSVTTQKKVLETSAAQSKAAVESAKKQFRLEGTPAEAAVDSFQRGVETLVETQKGILDIAAKPFQPMN